MSQWTRDDWVAPIRYWMQRLSVSEGQIPTNVTLTLIRMESTYDPTATGGNRYIGLLQTGNAYLQDASERLQRELGTQEYERAFGKNWSSNSKAEKFIRTTDVDGSGRDREGQYRSGWTSIAAFLAYMKRYDRRHQYVPDLIALTHKLPSEGSAAGQRYRGAVGTPTERLAEALAPTFARNRANSGEYVRIFQGRYNPSESTPGGGTNISRVENSIGTPPANRRGFLSTEKTPNIIYNDGEIDGGSPFTLSNYLLPEELARGINAQIYNLNDWFLNQLADNDVEDEVKTTEENPFLGGFEDEENNSSGPSESVGEATIFRSDKFLDERRRYVYALVEAEYYRRRFAARQVPALTGRFWPFYVAGLPGLILDPRRPVLAQISSVSHTIDVAGGEASTSVSFTSPRYWDEGEVFYWSGGHDLTSGRQDIPSVSEDNEIFYRRFPQWHNRYSVASNSYARGTFDKNGARIQTKLDQFYEFYLGVPAIPYMSNNAERVDSPEPLKRAIKERDPGPFEVNPQNLQVIERNMMIAETYINDEGREVYAPWTLAGKCWGEIEPDGATQAEPNVSFAPEMSERIAVSEAELMVGFLNSRRQKYGELDVYTGEAFGNEDGEASARQALVLSYIEAIEKKKVGGGY